MEAFERYRIEEHEAERQKRFDEIDAENKAVSRLKAQQAKDAFDNLTTAQHLAAARDALKIDASSDQVSEAMKHLAALHGTPFEGQGETLRNRYEAEKRKAEKAQAAAAAASEAKEKKEDAAVKEVLRENYAKTLQNNLLSQDMDADVDAIGSGHTTLRVTWVLATKVFVYKISQSSEFQSYFQDMRALGFKKFVVRDGYDKSSTWNLDD